MPYETFIAFCITGDRVNDKLNHCFEPSRFNAVVLSQNSCAVTFRTGNVKHLVCILGRIFADYATVQQLNHVDQERHQNLKATTLEDINRAELRRRQKILPLILPGNPNDADDFKTVVHFAAMIARKLGVPPTVDQLKAAWYRDKLMPTFSDPDIWNLKRVCSYVAKSWRPRPAGD